MPPTLRARCLLLGRIPVISICFFILRLFTMRPLAYAQSHGEPAPPGVSPETTAAIRQLISETIVEGQSYEYVRQLADTIGARLTGSENYMRSATWAMARFREAGLAHVHTEDWIIPAAWEPNVPATGRIRSPVDHTLHIYSAGWSPSTPESGVDGDVVYVPSLEPAVLESQRAKLKDAIAFLDPHSLSSALGLDTILAGMDLLRSCAPAAILFPSGPNGTESSNALNFSGEIDAVPEAQIGPEDALLIRRFLAQGTVRMQFAFANRIRRDTGFPT
jgi:carboxypeptidase Q